eukprot:scaffold183003_cov21-Tisochrysis_lutea.AAC.1
MGARTPKPYTPKPCHICGSSSHTRSPALPLGASGASKERVAFHGLIRIQAQRSKACQPTVFHLALISPTPAGPPALPWQHAATNTHPSAQAVGDMHFTNSLSDHSLSHAEPPPLPW